MTKERLILDGTLRMSGGVRTLHDKQTAFMASEICHAVADLKERGSISKTNLCRVNGGLEEEMDSINKVLEVQRDDAVLTFKKMLSQKKQDQFKFASKDKTKIKKSLSMCGNKKVIFK